MIILTQNFPAFLYYLNKYVYQWTIIWHETIYTHTTSEIVVQTVHIITVKLFCGDYLLHDFSVTSSLKERYLFSYDWRKRELCVNRSHIWTFKVTFPNPKCPKFKLNICLQKQYKLIRLHNGVWGIKRKMWCSLTKTKSINQKIYFKNK